MEKNLDTIIKNIQYHTSISKEKTNDDVLALIGFKYKSPRQNDMLNYYTETNIPSFKKKIEALYNK